jgi:hypothetical protein
MASTHRTHSSGEDDFVSGWPDIGGYLTKPFSLPDLLTIIRLLRTWKHQVKDDQHDVLLSSHPYPISRRQLQWYIGALNQTSQKEAGGEHKEPIESTGDCSFATIAEFQLR